MTLGKKPLENIVGKGENAGNQHFLLFPQCFLLFPIQILIFQSPLFCHLQVLSIWTSLNFAVWERVKDKHFLFTVNISAVWLKCNTSLYQIQCKMVFSWMISLNRKTVHRTLLWQILLPLPGRKILHFSKLTPVVDNKPNMVGIMGYCNRELCRETSEHFKISNFSFTLDL